MDSHGLGEAFTQSKSAYNKNTWLVWAVLASTYFQEGICTHYVIATVIHVRFRI